jgi:hypothetical protein
LPIRIDDKDPQSLRGKERIVRQAFRYVGGHFRDGRGKP